MHEQLDPVTTTPIKYYKYRKKNETIHSLLFQRLSEHRLPRQKRIQKCLLTKHEYSNTNNMVRTILKRS